MQAKSTSYNEMALQSGDAFPDFSFLDPNGVVVSSAELLMRGPLVVSFYIERLELNALSLALLEIKDSGGALVAISPAMLKEASPISIPAEFGLNFYLVSDHHAALARKAGLVHRRPVTLQVGSGKAKLPSPAICGSGYWEYRLPATYTVGQHNIIQDVFFGCGYYQPVKHIGFISDLETWWAYCQEMAAEK
jgi:peroxiredoxin